MAVKKKVARKKVAKKKVKKGTKKVVKRREPQAVREQIEVHAQPEDMAGEYSNFAVVKHSKREFIVDFVLRVDNTNFLVSRIITSPQQAKDVHRALGQNIEIYEKTHGKIPEE